MIEGMIAVMKGVANVHVSVEGDARIAGSWEERF
jgi:hypothetical protein